MTDPDGIRYRGGFRLYTLLARAETTSQNMNTYGDSNMRSIGYRKAPALGALSLVRHMEYETRTILDMDTISKPGQSTQLDKDEMACE
jgi:hypothetical protein